MATILVVEDDPGNRKLLVFMLEHAGHVVRQASDGEAAIAAVRDRQPDMVLMDVQMPGMDGIATAAILKRDAATAAIPIIALTACAMKGDAEKMLAAGFQGYLAKPFHHGELLSAVKMACPPA